jgi:serine/threonine-protein kinase
LVQQRHLREATAGGAAPYGAMSDPGASLSTPAPLTYFQRADAVLGKRYRLEKMVAVSRERVLFCAWDDVLKRRVSLRANFYGDDQVRNWFLREAEALAHLDHPAIRHVYDAGVIGDLAFRVGNWIDGESLLDAVQRGPRPLPAVHTLARDVLGALEHAHAHGVIVRRIVPASVLLNMAGRCVVTDVRYCNWTLPAIPPREIPTGMAYMAPEVRNGETGDPAADNYTAGAILYYAVTGQEPPLDSSAI